MKRPISSVVLICLVLFQAVSAIPSGFSMILDPKGELLGLPIQMLERAPFSDFLIPGIFLTVVLGLFPVVIIYGLITRRNPEVLQRINPYNHHHWAHTYAYYLGIILILWINMQLLFGLGFHIYHFIYSCLGVLIVIFSQLPGVRNYYLQPRKKID